MFFFIFFAVLFINFTFVVSQAYTISACSTSNPAIARSIFEIIKLLIKVLYVLHFPILVALIEHEIIQQKREQNLDVFNLLLLASSIGASIGLFYLDFSEKIISKLVTRIYQTKDDIQFFKWGLQNVYKLPNLIISYHFKWVREARLPRMGKLPIKFMLVCSTSMIFMFIGNYACLFAGIIYPNYRMTAMSLTGIINGLATASAVIFIDVKISLYVDMVNKMELPIYELKQLVYVYGISVVIGSICAQILLRPTADFIVVVLKLIS